MRPTDAGQDGDRGLRATNGGGAWIARRMWVGRALMVLIAGAMVGLVGRLSYIQGKMRPELLEWSQRRQ